MSRGEKPSFQISADCRALAQCLREAAIGDVVTYEALSNVIGRNVRDDARGALSSARRLVMREYRAVFDSIKGKGLQRLDDKQIVNLGDKTRAHIRRTVRKTAKALVCVEYDAMSKPEQIRHNTALSMLGAIGEMATEKATTRLANAVESAGQEIPAAKSAIAALGATV